MPVITKWSNVAVNVQSALAAAKTITAISKASTAVVSSTAHGYLAGDYVVLSAQGMYQVNARCFRVGTVPDANTFQLESVDSSTFATFESGSAQKVTFGTTLSTLVSVNASGGDFDFIDTTTIHSDSKTQIPGQASPLTFNFESYWDPSDVGLLALRSASTSQAQRAVQFSFANGQKFVFNGYIGCSLTPTGSAQDLVKTGVTITALAGPMAYAS